MLHDFSDQFQHFLLPTEKEVESALTSGLIVLDTNVLLSAYRFAEEAREQLISVIERLADRLFLPHQVGLEFHRRRIEVMRGYGSSYDKVLGVVKEKQRELDDSLTEPLRQLANRASLLDAQLDEALNRLTASLKPLRLYIEELLDNHKLVESGPDAVLARLQAVFAGRVGSPFTPEVEAQQRQKFAVRADQKIPPGYKDAPNHGDYFVWRQSLDEAKHRNAATLLIVTDDVKEDWYLRVQGQTVGARPELVDEAFREAGSRLIILPTKGLLREAAKYLNATVSDETIRQAEELRRQDAEDSVEMLSPRSRSSFSHDVVHAALDYERRVRDVIQGLFAQDPGIDVLDEDLDSGLDLTLFTPRGTAAIVIKYTLSGTFGPRNARPVLQLPRSESIGGIVCVTNGILARQVEEYNATVSGIEFLTWNSDVDNNLLHRAILRNIY